MPVFVGTHINKIDRKGRVSVPAPFRNALGESASHGGVYVMRSIRGVEALDAFTPKVFADIAGNIANPFASEHEDFTNAIFGASMLLAFDGEGRILLPEPFRAFARLDGEACFIGRGIFFQIWEPETGRRQQEEAFRRATENRSEIRLSLAGAPERAS